MPNLNDYITYNGTNWTKRNINVDVMKVVNNGTSFNYLNLNGNQLNSFIKKDVYLSGTSSLFFGNPNNTNIGHTEIISQIQDGYNLMSLLNAKNNIITNYYSMLDSTAGSITLSVSSGTNAYRYLEISSNKNFTFFGTDVRYDKDYTSRYTLKSLVHKGYVDNKIFTLTGAITGSGSNGSISTSISNNTIIFSKIQTINNNKLLGRSSSSGGNLQEITIGGGLKLQNGILSSTSGAGISSLMVAGSNGSVQFNNTSTLTSDSNFYWDNTSKKLLIGSSVISNNIISINKSTPTATLDIVQPISSSGTPVGFLFTAGAHTNLTASTEINDVIINLNRTLQRATGAVTTQRSVYIQAPTYSFVGASTITDSSTVAISGSPVAGANATLTRSYALWIQGGVSRFDGNLVFRGATRNIGTEDAFAIVLQTNGTQRVTISNAGTLTAQMSAQSSGSTTHFTLTGASHTNQTASTETIDVNFNLNRTLQHATGALPTQRAFVIQAPTYSFVGASTITNSATVAITGAPVVGTNATITNNYALWIQSGTTRLDGNLSLNDSSGIAFSTIVGSKIGTSTTQKLAFWNATPIIQPSSANQTILTDSTTGTPSATFTMTNVGVVFNQATLNNNFATLIRLINEMQSVLVNTGIMKGSA